MGHYWGLPIPVTVIPVRRHLLAAGRSCRDRKRPRLAGAPREGVVTVFCKTQSGTGSRDESALRFVAGY